jgi:cobalt-zinc-cadmium efflux system outer membrane protein
LAAYLAEKKLFVSLTKLRAERSIAALSLCFLLATTSSFAFADLTPPKPASAKHQNNNPLADLVRPIAMAAPAFKPEDDFTRLAPIHKAPLKTAELYTNPQPSSVPSNPILQQSSPNPSGSAKPVMPGSGLNSDLGTPDLNSSKAPITQPSTSQLKPPISKQTKSKKPKAHQQTDAAIKSQKKFDKQVFGKKGKTKAETGPTSVSIVQAMDESLVNNPRVTAITYQLGITKSAYASALTFPNPSLILNNGYGGLSFQQGVNVPIEEPWKVMFRLVVAKLLVNQTRLELLTQLWQFRAEIRRAYTECVVAQEAYDTLSDFAEIAEQLLNVSQKRFQAGDVPELDVLKARLALAQTRIDMNFGFQRVIRAKQQLNVMMARALDTSIEVPRLPMFTLHAEVNDLLPNFDIPVLPLNDYLTMAKQNRYELLAIRKSIQTNKAQLANAIGNILPTPQFLFGRDYSGNPPKGESPATVGLLFNAIIELPVLNLQQGPIAKYIATIKQQKKQLEAQENIIEQQVSNAYYNLIAAREKIRTYQEHVLNEAREVTRLARRSYEVGQSDITSTLQVQQQNVYVRSQYVEAINQYETAYTDLEQAINQVL